MPHSLLILALLAGCSFSGDTATAEVQARQEARAIQPVDLANLGDRLDAIRDAVRDGAGDFEDADARQAFLERAASMDQRLVLVLKNRYAPDFAEQVVQLDREITWMEDYVVESEALDQ